MTDVGDRVEVLLPVPLSDDYGAHLDAPDERDDQTDPLPPPTLAWFDARVVAIDHDTDEATLRIEGAPPDWEPMTMSVQGDTARRWRRRGELRPADERRARLLVQGILGGGSKQRVKLAARVLGSVLRRGARRQLLENLASTAENEGAPDAARVDALLGLAVLLARD